MDFESEAQRACYEKIQPWIQEIYGEFAVAREDIPAFDVYYGSSRTSIAVLPWGDGDSVVTCIAWLAEDVELTAELLTFLIMENVGMRFGAFGIDKDGSICFRHTIRGSSCRKADLRASSWGVITTANRYDRELIARWGRRGNSKVVGPAGYTYGDGRS